ncbi:hypothetical protein FF38_07622 [Lucilia cuprina]|uniref:Uncharacterized protein n=1 Tax=Lucilia cuprina TaxID=7375 RepID=A0A0L0BZG9_LUCCU|nr:hypothetical protein FF38_07622 [Lucilia cuprina]
MIFTKKKNVETELKYRKMLNGYIRFFFTFGIFGSLDKAKNTLSNIFSLTKRSFSSAYKSTFLLRQPKKSQTLGIKFANTKEAGGLQEGNSSRTSNKCGKRQWRQSS